MSATLAANASIAFCLAVASLAIAVALLVVSVDIALARAVASAAILAATEFGRVTLPSTKLIRAPKSL